MSAWPVMIDYPYNQGLTGDHDVAVISYPDLIRGLVRRESAIPDLALTLLTDVRLAVRPLRYRSRRPPGVVPRWRAPLPGQSARPGVRSVFLAFFRAGLAVRSYQLDQ